MTQIEFLEDGFRQGFLEIRLHADGTYVYNCKNLISCGSCTYRPYCNTITCGIESHHPELFQQLKDKYPHLFI